MEIEIGSGSGETQTKTFSRILKNGFNLNSGSFSDSMGFTSDDTDPIFGSSKTAKHAYIEVSNSSYADDFNSLISLTSPTNWAACGGISFGITVSTSGSSAAQLALADLLSLNVTMQSDGHYQATVNMKPTNDVSLVGASLTVTLKGWQTLHPQNIYTKIFKVSAAKNCPQSSFSSAPVISPAQINFYPSMNETLTIPVNWAIDTAGANRVGGCGPYTLKLTQQQNEPLVDSAKTIITVVNNKTISFNSQLDTVPITELYKDFNFDVWIEGALITYPSPSQTVSMRVWDTCNKAAGLFWESFTNMNLDVGSGYGVSQTRKFSRKGKGNNNGDGNNNYYDDKDYHDDDDYDDNDTDIDDFGFGDSSLFTASSSSNKYSNNGTNGWKYCGDMSFDFSVITTSDAEQALADLISIKTQTVIESGFDKNYVSVLVQPTNDYTLVGTSVVVTIIGWQKDHPLIKTSTTFTVTAILTCVQSSIPSAPVITQNPFNYFPELNGTVSIPVQWIKDRIARSRIDGCGPYTLKVFQSLNDEPLDSDKTTIEVADEYNIRFNSELSVVPAGQPYKDFNFYGWVEGDLVSQPSPTYYLVVRVWDSCAVKYVYNFVWDTFTDMQVQVGSEQSITQSRTFYEQTENGLNWNSCGGISLNFALSTPTSTQEQILFDLISFDVKTDSDSSQVSITVQPSDDESIVGVSLVATLTGFQIQRPDNTFQVTFSISAIASNCWQSVFPSPPYIPMSPINYYPSVNGTASITVLWELDDLAYQRAGGCGPYTLRLFQTEDEERYDTNNMMIAPINNRTISLYSKLQIVPVDALYKDFSFYGFIEGALVLQPSPSFLMPVRIWDSCSAVYDLAWNKFSDIQLELGSGVGVNETRTFNRTVKPGFYNNGNNDWGNYTFQADSQSILVGSKYNNWGNCGSMSFSLTLSDPTSAEEQKLANLISFEVRIEDTASYVSVLVQPSDDYSLFDVSLTVTLTGWLTLRPQKTYSTTFIVFASVQCIASSFPQAPSIPSSPVNYWPQQNGTIQIPVLWEIDTFAFNRNGGCGPYTLNLIQEESESPYDTTMMSVQVFNNHTISLISTINVIPIDALYKDFNFYGWIEGALVSEPSPNYQLSIRVWDTCTAAYDLVWNVFSDMEVEIGSGVGLLQEKTFTRRLKNGYSFQTNSVQTTVGFGDSNLMVFGDNNPFGKCGGMSFLLELSSPNSASEEALASLIHLVTTNGVDMSYVAVSVDPTDDLSLEGTSLFVTLKGWQTLRPLKSYTITFKVSATLKCRESAFTMTPFIPSSPIDYYPALNDTIRIPVEWELDTQAANRVGGCGPYTLRLFQEGAETPVDDSKFIITVANNKTISLYASQNVVPVDALYIDYNFYGWIEGALVSDPTPTFYLPVRVWDSCAAAFNLSWDTFSDIEIEIGSGYGQIMQSKNFTRNLKPYFKDDGSWLSTCGGMIFELTKEEPTSAAQHSLSDLINLSTTNSDSQSYVSVVVQPTDDYSLKDVSLTIKLKGYQTNHPSKSFTQEFKVFASLYCKHSKFLSAPTEDPDRTYYYVGPEVGQGDFQVAVAWEEDTVSAYTGESCGGYNLVRHLSRCYSLQDGEVQWLTTPVENAFGMFVGDPTICYDEFDRYFNKYQEREMYDRDVDHDWSGKGNHYRWDDVKKQWFLDAYHIWEPYFVNYTLTETQQVDENQFIFRSDQSNLGGSLLAYNISVSSTNIRHTAPTSTFFVNVLNCTQKYRDWITTKNPSQNVRYDLQNPYEELATFQYLGPPLAACGNPDITFQHEGTTIDFLTYSFDENTQIITVKFDNPTYADRASYDIDAVINSPGPFTWSLGINLEVFDSCDETQILTGGTYEKMNYSTQSTSPTVFSLIEPDVTYAQGARAKKCGPIKYEIISSTRNDDSDISLGSDLVLDLDQNELVLESTNYGKYKVTIKVYIQKYPDISDTTTFDAEVADCTIISISAVDDSASTEIVRLLFDPAIYRYYLLEGNFDVCDKSIVELTLYDESGMKQAPEEIFSVRYRSENTTIIVKFKPSEDLSLLGVYDLVFSFTLPSEQTLPTDSYLLRVNIDNPCVNVPVTSAQKFALTKQVTFDPFPANYVRETPGCGVLEVETLDCQGFRDGRADLNADLNGYINLNWDTGLINRTIACKFTYKYTDRPNNQQTGASFNVEVQDPCLFGDTYTFYTDSATDSYSYNLGTETLKFDVWFKSEIDTGTNTFDFCGPLTAVLSPNKTTNAFLRSTFDSRTNTFSVEVVSRTAADLGWYLSRVKVTTDVFDQTATFGGFILNVYSDNSCSFSTVLPLDLKLQTYFVWQPKLTQKINVTDNCDGCGCQYLLSYSHVPQNGTASYLTLDTKSGEFEIYSNKIESVNNNDEKYVTEITVQWIGFPATGTWSGYLRYELLHPCLANIGLVTFDRTLVQYDVGQYDYERVFFTYKDSVSALSSVENYCGKPAVSYVFEQVYDQGFVTYFNLVSSDESNNGYVQYDERMNDRLLSDSYKFQIQLSYTNGSIVSLSEDTVELVINDPCIYTVLPEQSFFANQNYFIKTYGESESFDFSADYKADNVTVWSTIDYFCGYPHYLVSVTDENDQLVYKSDAEENGTNFTSIENAYSYPPDTYTTVLLNSTDNKDYTSDFYTIKVQPILDISTNVVFDEVTFQIADACLVTTMVDSYSFKDITYQLGSAKVKTDLIYTVDTRTQFFYEEKAQNFDECGEHKVVCKVQTTSSITFFNFEQDLSNDNNTYSYSISSDSSIDLGVWNVECTFQLIEYPLVNALVQTFKVTINDIPLLSSIPGETLGPCIGSTDAKNCEKFLYVDPPYFATWPESANQFSSLTESFGVDIKQATVQFDNNITVSKVTCDSNNQQYLNDLLTITVTTEDLEFFGNLGNFRFAQASTQPIQFGLYCPIEFLGNQVDLTIKLGWKGVDLKQNTYKLPIFCSACDFDDCNSTSWNYYATTADWRIKYHAPPVLISDPNTPLPTVNGTVVTPVVVETVQFQQPVAGDSTSLKPQIRDLPELQLPNGDGKTYLDFSFNAVVPVRLANGQIVEVKMCAPNVDQISNTGLVKIVFSKPIETIASNLYKEIESSGIIQAQLLLGSELDPGNIESAQVLYTFAWNLVETNPEYVIIQILFGNPGAISSSSTAYDYIQVSFVNSGRYFKCVSSLVGLDLEGATARLLQQTDTTPKPPKLPSADTSIPTGFRVQYPLPPQVDPGVGAVMKKIVFNIAKTTNSIIFVTVILALALHIRLDMLWGGINALQIISFLSYSNVAWPSTISFLFDALNMITQFDFLDPFFKAPSASRAAIDCKWTPTDPKGNSLVRQNGGTLTFLPNLGSVAMFLHIAFLYTIMAPLGRILQKMKVCKRSGVLKNLTPNSDKLANQWLRIFIECFVVLYMYLLLGLQMANQLKPNLRNSCDRWSITMQSILIVPVLGFPLLIIWFALYHSRAFVSYHKVQFFLDYQDRLHQEQLKVALSKPKVKMIDELENPLAALIPQRQNLSKEKSIDLDIQDDQIYRESPVQIEVGQDLEKQGGDKVETRTVRFAAAQDTPVKSLLLNKLMVKIDTDVKKGLQNKLEDLQKNHKELQDHIQLEKDHIKRYKKFETLHKELNHHSYISQYYWVFFLFRRIIFLTVCVLSRNSFAQVATYIVVNMACSSYIYIANPFFQVRKHYMENYNEAMIFLCGIFQMVLAGITIKQESVPEGSNPGSLWQQFISSGNSSVRQILSNLICIIVFSMIILNGYLAVSDIGHQFVLVFKQKYAQWKARQATIKKRVTVKKYASSNSQLNEDSSQVDQNTFRHLLGAEGAIVSAGQLSSNGNISSRADEGTVPPSQAIVSEKRPDEYQFVFDQNVASSVANNVPFVRAIRRITPLDSGEVSRAQTPQMAKENENFKARFAAVDESGIVISTQNSQIIAKKQTNNKLLLQAVQNKMIEDDMPEGDVKVQPRKNQPRGANVFKNRLQQDNVNIFNVANATPLKNGYTAVDMNTPYTAKKADLDRLESMSANSDDVDYVDQAHDRLNDTYRHLEDQLEDISRIKVGSNDSAEIQSEGKPVFGIEYRGDLQSFRLNNKSQAEVSDQQYNLRVNGLNLVTKEQERDTLRVNLNEMKGKNAIRTTEISQESAVLFTEVRTVFAPERKPNIANDRRISSHHTEQEEEEVEGVYVNYATVQSQESVRKQNLFLLTDVNENIRPELDEVKARKSDYTSDVKQESSELHTQSKYGLGAGKIFDTNQTGQNLRADLDELKGKQVNSSQVEQESSIISSDGKSFFYSPKKQNKKILVGETNLRANMNEVSKKQSDSSMIDQESSVAYTVVRSAKNGRVTTKQEFDSLRANLNPIDGKQNNQTDVDQESSVAYTVARSAKNGRVTTKQEFDSLRANLNPIDGKQNNQTDVNQESSVAYTVARSAKNARVTTKPEFDSLRANLNPIDGKNNSQTDVDQESSVAYTEGKSMLSGLNKQFNTKPVEETNLRAAMNQATKKLSDSSMIDQESSVAQTEGKSMLSGLNKRFDTKPVEETNLRAAMNTVAKKNSDSSMIDQESSAGSVVFEGGAVNYTKRVDTAITAQVNIKAGLNQITAKQLRQETIIDQQSNAQVLQGRFSQPQTKQVRSKQTVDDFNANKVNLNEMATKKVVNTVVEQETSVVHTEARSAYPQRVETKPGTDTLRVDLNEIGGKNVQNTVVEQEESSVLYTEARTVRENGARVEKNVDWQINIKTGLNEVVAKSVKQETAVDMQSTSKVSQGRFALGQHKQPRTKVAVDEMNTLRADMNEVLGKKVVNTYVDQESSVVQTEGRSAIQQRQETKPGAETLRVDLNEVAAKYVQNTVVDQESSVLYTEARTARENNVNRVETSSGQQVNVKTGFDEVVAKSNRQETAINDSQSVAKVSQGRFTHSQNKQPRSKNVVDEVNTLKADLNQVYGQQNSITTVHQESSVVQTEQKSMVHGSKRQETKPQNDTLRVNLNEFGGKNVHNTTVDQESSVMYTEAKSVRDNNRADTKVSGETNLRGGSKQVAGKIANNSVQEKESSIKMTTEIKSVLNSEKSLTSIKEDHNPLKVDLYELSGKQVLQTIVEQESSIMDSESAFDNDGLPDEIAQPNILKAGLNQVTQKNMTQTNVDQESSVVFTEGRSVYNKRVATNAGADSNLRANINEVVGKNANETVLEQETSVIYTEARSVFYGHTNRAETQLGTENLRANMQQVVAKTANQYTSVDQESSVVVTEGRSVYNNKRLNTKQGVEVNNLKAGLDEVPEKVAYNTLIDQESSVMYTEGRSVRQTEAKTGGYELNTLRPGFQEVQDKRALNTMIDQESSVMYTENRSVRQTEAKTGGYEFNTLRPGFQEVQDKRALNTMIDQESSVMQTQGRSVYNQLVNTKVGRDAENMRVGLDQVAGKKVNQTTVVFQESSVCQDSAVVFTEGQPVLGQDYRGDLNSFKVNNETQVDAIDRKSVKVNSLIKEPALGGVNTLKVEIVEMAAKNANNYPTVVASESSVSDL